MTTSLSSVVDLIESQNPFDRSLVVRQQDIWGNSFPDIPSLNAHASDTIIEAVKQVRTGQRPVIGITITAERGVGKSHIISRVHRLLQGEGGALFVYMSEYGDLNRIKSGFLQTLASSLKKIGSQDVMQWQELATSLVNEAMRSSYIPKQLVDGFPGLLAKNSKLVDALTTKVLEAKPEIDNPYLIRGIFWTLSPTHAPFAINWLSGRDLAQSQAEAMGLPNPSNEEKEAESFNTVCQILDLIGDYRALVVCLDELDGAGCDLQGFTRAMVAASLGKDLYNKIKRGILLMAMYPETWRDQVSTMPHAEAVTDRVGEKVTDLRYLNSDNVVALVSQWLKEFYDANGITPPHPVYPFYEGKLRELGREKPIVRRVLKWCADNFKVSNSSPLLPVSPPDKIHPVALAFENELTALQESIEDYLENKFTLADAMWLGFSALSKAEQTVMGVQVRGIEEIEVNSTDQGYIDFRIIGKEQGKDIKIGVAVVQQSGGRGVQAALKRLVNYKKFDLTRGCLVRSKAIGRNAAQAQKYLSKLLSTELGGEWALLKSDDIKPLLAISFVYFALKDYELSEEQVFDFIDQKRLVIDNPLIREILSNPSGQAPDDAINEDIPIDVSSMGDIPSSVDMPELASIAN